MEPDDDGQFAPGCEIEVGGSGDSEIETVLADFLDGGEEWWHCIPELWACGAGRGGVDSSAMRR